MFEVILRQIQASVRDGRYVMTLHAEEEMNDDDLSIFDVEAAILSGAIAERQRDHRTGEWKYLICEPSTTKVMVEVATKLRPNDLVVILTVYVLRGV